MRRKTANRKQLTVDELETERKLTGDKAENEKLTSDKVEKEES